MNECAVHLVPLRDGACWACRWGQEPQARCALHGTYAASCDGCPRCRLEAMGRANREGQGHG